MKRNFIEIMFAVVLSFIFTMSVFAQGVISFSGDLVINGDSSTTKAKVYAKGLYIRRVEMSEDDGGKIFISPKDARGKVWMLDPIKKQYKILSWPEIHNDPISAWTDIQYEMSGSLVGEDTLDGYKCFVYEFKYSHNEEVALKLWLAEELHYTIKRVAHAKIILKKNAEPVVISGTFRIINIKVEELDDELFKIPPDYSEIK